MKVVIYGNINLDERADEVNTLYKALKARGVEVLTGVDPSRVDMVISVGGDGTLLHTARSIVGCDTPVVGINGGHLGYLTAASLSAATAMVDALADGDYRIEQRTTLTVESDALDEPLPLALNEVALLRQDTSSVIEMVTTLRGEPLNTYVGDGLVISTPTGSTAYNMSAGGPILEPTTRCIVLTPVSPHSLTTRPLVVSDDSELQVTTRSRANHYLVSIDGDSVVLPAGSTVTVRVSPHRLNLVMPRHNNFASTLRNKLHWGV